ncbi:glycosyltransferase [Arthrobacter sp. Sa2CUA1]|uniref:Glycosyltransferase n=1 Tax=Arthrobacter gallicola TaxID=2762225 RepID=A0ABR8UQ50_9MICC|nr:glycosyltransferase family 4 protein [Arthrobacter gallicola]MBD7994485.1 glycosyltransferase [Arthrobacter gallicola]
MRAGRLVGNLGLAAGTVWEHLGDDPALLALQVSRRLPAGAVRPAARAAAQMPGVVLPAMAAVIQGRSADAGSLLSGALDTALRPRSAVRLADTAIAAGLPDLAAQLLKAAPERTAGKSGAAARLLWHQGAMTEAVQTLRDGNAAERRQGQRLASELRVFEGWAPSLAPVRGYQPRERTVLHLLTNSLPYTGSGYAQRSHSLLTAQGEQGWNVHAVTRVGYPVQVGQLGARDTDVLDGVTYHRLLPGRLPRGMAARLALQAEEVLELALRLRPAVLHTTTHFVNGAVVRAVAHALGIPWVYEVRGQLADTWASTRGPKAKNSERYARFTEREAEIMRSADAVATLGEQMLQGVLRSGVPETATVLLPNAVGGDFLTAPLSAADARRTLGLPPSGMTIGTVSSLVDYEGIDDLIRAFALLAPEHPDLACLIVGDGASAPALRTLAADLGVGERVTFTGRVPRERAHLHHQAIDVFVVPRKDLDVTRAVTPLKPVEAMACSRPVIASSLPALGELVEHGTNGYLVRPEDPAQLAEYIEYLIQDPALRDRLGRDGREHVLTRRTWHAAAQRSTALYTDLISSEGHTQ